MLQLSKMSLVKVLIDISSVLIPLVSGYIAAEVGMAVK